MLTSGKGCKRQWGNNQPGLNGGSGGARTRDKSNVYGHETGLPSQIASQLAVPVGHDLAQVVTAWAKLSPSLKTAILAIVNSATEGEAQSKPQFPISPACG